MVEVRKINGCDELFNQVYTSFKNFMLGENKVIQNLSTFNIEGDKEEEEDPILSILKWMRQNPGDGIKTVVILAMERNEYRQNVICNEVIKTINMNTNVYSIAPQILGFIDTMKTSPYFKLGEEYRNANIQLLKQILIGYMKKIKNKSVQLRIQEL